MLLLNHRKIHHHRAGVLFEFFKKCLRVHKENRAQRNRALLLAVMIYFLRVLNLNRV